MSLWQYANYHTQETAIYSPRPCKRVTGLSSNCLCDVEMPDFIERIIKFFIGPDGTRSARWRHFEVDLGGCIDDTRSNRAIAVALSQPTPMLETLVLKNVRMGMECAGLRLFPDIKSMNSITILDSRLTVFPNFVKVQKATLGWEFGDASNQGLDIRPSAARLRYLRMSVNQMATIILPPILPALTHLHLSGDDVSLSLYECDMPRLAALTVDIGNNDLIDLFTDCESLHAEKLRTVTVRWYQSRAGYWLKARLLESLPRLLSQFPNIDTIRMNRWILDLLLKVIWELPQESRRAVTSGKRVINMDLDCFYGFDGTEDNHSLELLAAEWDLVPPNLPYQEFMDAL
ncbi:hypothetical protein M408DRAFT_22496 [Serendipita vermifera MAFF 305830]|uniref:F-box domain-containing protein n=1 Tax=Serendipita vermifera MAFF 305830 TaxID=933852 RepID=A0A0C3AZZ5_SERVB|nr:hypothetical protein M408DRAFT_22496 [Serendipita vermifera MAFF 305830]